ncbi:hypothetical protein U1Q18_052214 [Sarracenia purpurea var. burkii]
MVTHVGQQRRTKAPPSRNAVGLDGRDKRVRRLHETVILFHRSRPSRLIQFNDTFYKEGCVQEKKTKSSTVTRNTSLESWLLADITVGALHDAVIDPMISGSRPSHITNVVMDSIRGPSCITQHRNRSHDRVDLDPTALYNTLTRLSIDVCRAITKRSESGSESGSENGSESGSENGSESGGKIGWLEPARTSSEVKFMLNRLIACWCE